MEHTQDCSRRHSEAEEAASTTLFNPDCPRCKLNFAAPDLLEACKKLVVFADEILPQAGKLFFDIGNLNTALYMARPAIAKAKP